MIKHIVMWKFKDEAEGKSKDENIQIIKKDLENLVGVIPEIRELEVGINKTVADTAFDAVLVSTFDSMEDLKAYREDPRHKKAAAYNKLCRLDRVVVDYEF
ncbi:Dabb family protein [Oceanispirochaeta crateris]|uniref:Dabb family protein n=1 Tax=Oceanispirochaeta crateris TaxID=2518645 RepID=A0A5C1QG99_9SPIO|nr:Dabb family protein [Oceanispirochaeta crateris]QEN07193.1 Dabb family protein [Oceanispirochaeta crateris]